MKKVLTLVLMLLSLVSYSQREWKDLYEDKKLIFYFDVDQSNLFIRINDKDFQVKKDKKLDISTDEGYISLPLKSSIVAEDFTILIYTVSPADKNRISKYLSEDILLHAVNKTYYMRIDSLTRNEMIKKFKVK